MTRFKRGLYAEAADDFASAIAKDAENPTGTSAELSKLLKNALDKHEEVEGRPYEGYRRKLDPTYVETAPAPTPTTAPALASTPSKMSNEGAKVAKPSAETAAARSMFPPTEDVTVEIATDSSDLFDFTCGPSGKLMDLGDVYLEGNLIEYPGYSPYSLSTQTSSAEPSGTFTRVAIIEDDDSDEDEDEDENEEGEEVEIKVSGVADADKSGVPSNGFTRVNIVDDDDSDEEEGEEPNVSSEAKECVGKTALEWKEEGNKLLSGGDAVGAVSAYTSALEREPTMSASWNNRGMAHIALKDYKSARDDFDAVLQLDDKNSKALYRRALCRKELGDNAGAMADAKALLKIDPSNAQATQLLREIENSTSTAQAKPSPEKLKSSNSVESGKKENVGNSSAGEWELGVREAKQRALRSIEAGDATAAVGACSEALAKLYSSGISESSETKQTEVSILTLLCTAYGSLGKDSDVEATCSRILSLDPKNFRALVKRADAKAKKGTWEACKTDALAALRIDATDTEAMSLIDLAEQHLNPPAQEATSSLPSPPPTQKKDVVEPPAPPTESKTEASGANAAVSSSLASVTAEAESLKDQGNAAMKAEDFTGAAEFYTQALVMTFEYAIKSKETGSVEEVEAKVVAAIRNNRAQAYLKLNRFVDAESDATAAIAAANKSGSSAASTAIVHKAQYRRGIARRAMGSKEQLHAALADFTALVHADPSSAVFKREKEKTAMLLKEKEAPVNVSASKAAVAAAPATNGSDSDDKLGMRAVSSKKITPAGSAETPAKAETPTKTENSVPSKSDKGSSSKKGTTKASMAAMAAKRPDVPAEAPKTMYELERVWRALKSYPDLFAQYLSTFKKSTCKRVFKESVSMDLLTSLLVSMRDYSEASTITTILEGLTQASGFSMTVQLLPEEDLACLRNIFEKVSASGGDTEKLDKLRNMYCV
jgi:tetratricopeptide (TPR) repeat protein